MDMALKFQPTLEEIQRKSGKEIKVPKRPEDSLLYSFLRCFHRPLHHIHTLAICRDSYKNGEKKLEEENKKTYTNLFLRMVVQAQTFTMAIQEDIYNKFRKNQVAKIPLNPNRTISDGLRLRYHSPIL